MSVAARSSAPLASSTLNKKRKVSAPRTARAPAAPPAAESRRVAVSPGTLALCAYAYNESRRRGLLPEGCTLDSWMEDAITERACHVAAGMMNIGDMGELRFLRKPRVSGPDGALFVFDFNA